MNLQPADKGSRLYNYVVDTTAISIVIFFGFFFAVMGFRAENNLIFYTICFLGYYGYYFLFEWKTGKTLGKLLSHTRVINTLGETPSLKQIIIRTLLRIPIVDGISLLLAEECGIHDKLSGTMVIKN